MTLLVVLSLTFLLIVNENGVFGFVSGGAVVFLFIPLFIGFTSVFSHLLVFGFGKMERLVQSIQFLQKQ
jgi:hypothetical protein